MCTAMFRACHVLLTLVIVKLAQIGYCVEDEAIRTLYKTLSQDGWDKMDNSEYIGSDLNKVNLKLKTNNERSQSLAYIYDAEVIAIIMYNALGCKLTDTMKVILKTELTTKGDYKKTRQRLADINRIVLKVVNGLFNLAELFPYVLSLEPGVLRIALSLNLRLNRIMADFDSHPLTDQTDSVDFDHEIFAMINTVERFTIAFCSPKFQTWFLKKDHALGSIELIGYLENVVDSTGLVRLDYDKYDVMARAPSVADGLNQFSVIHYVSNMFNSLLGLSVVKGITFMDFNDVLQYQEIIYDFLRLAIHIKTLSYLEELEELQNSYEPALPDNHYLGQTNIQKHNLVKFYQRLLKDVGLMEFPLEIVRQVGLMMKLVTTVMTRKTVPGRIIFIEHEKQNIDFIKQNTFNKSLLNIIIKRFTLSEQNGIELHTFLKDVLSVKFVKYYNNIFKLSKHNFHEINFVDKIDNAKVSNAFIFIYARCFDILSSVNRNETAREKLINTFNDILNNLKFILYVLLYSYPNIDLTILNEADYYLRYNLLKYPAECDIIQKKLYTIIYMFTNMIDRYQIIFIKNHKLRDDLFNEESFPENYQNIKSFNHLSSYNDLMLVETEAKLNNCILFMKIYDFRLELNVVTRLAWKDQFLSIKEIFHNVNDNLFDLYFFYKYVELFLEWISALVTYTILDVIESLLVNQREKLSMIYDIEIWKDIYIWPKGCSVAMQTVFSRITQWTPTGIVTSFEIMEMQSILEYNLMQHSSMVERYGTIRNAIRDNYFRDSEMWNSLSPILSFINYGDESFEICEISESVKPFVFYLERFLKYYCE